jgi:hypothetical protein
MRINLSSKDWIDISAYLDERLSSADVARFQNRLKTDPQFNQAFLEIQHTRKLLRSLPAKRAPRNFTLSQQYAKAPARRWGIQSFLGLASGSAALALVVLFAWTNSFQMSAKMAPAALSLSAAAPEAAMDSSLAATGESNSAPMIITWDQNNQAYGMGGGGNSTSLTGKGIGGGENPVTANPITVEATPSPQMTAEAAANVDPSTLILGLPAPGTGGEEINRSTSESVTSQGVQLPTATLWMIGLGGIAFITGLLALFFRRR